MQSRLNIDFQDRYAHYTFKGKREDEVIVLLLRRHWLVLSLRMFPLLIAFFALLAMHFMGPTILNLADIRRENTLFYLIESFLWMFFWLILFITWLDYYLDVWIVTDQRIINIEQHGLFRRQISELDHEKIQDVTSEVHGVVPTLFNFGDVYIQSAAERERFLFKQVPDPVRVRNIVMELQQWAILRERKEESAIWKGKV